MLKDLDSYIHFSFPGSLSEELGESHRRRVAIGLKKRKNVVEDRESKFSHFYPLHRLSLTWISNYIIITCGRKLLIHSQTSMAALLKLGMDKYLNQTLCWACEYLSMLGFNPC